MKLKSDRPERQVKKGMSGTAPYTAWVNMKCACNSVGHKGYSEAGKLGLGYVAAWNTFEGFWKSMRATYTEGSRLTRYDKTKSFMKGNCYWKTKDGSPPPIEDKCASGIRGLREDTDHLGNTYWMVRYTQEGYRVTKLFSWNVHGEHKAYMLASIFLRSLRK